MTITLTPVAQTLISDVANVVRIDTLRSTPLIADRSTDASLECVVVDLPPRMAGDRLGVDSGDVVVPG